MHLRGLKWMEMPGQVGRACHIMGPRCLVGPRTIDLSLEIITTWGHHLRRRHLGKTCYARCHRRCCRDTMTSPC